MITCEDYNIKTEDIDNLNVKEEKEKLNNYNQKNYNKFHSIPVENKNNNFDNLNESYLIIKEYNKSLTNLNSTIKENNDKYYFSIEEINKSILI